MNAIDWIFLAIIGVSALFGLMRGFVGVVASFIAWVLAAWTAFRFGGDIGMWLADGTSPSAGEAFAGYAISFAGVLVIVGLLSMIIRRMLHTAGLSGIDRTLGLALGTARGIFIASALVLLVSFTPIVRRASYQDSMIAPLLTPLAGAMRGWLPGWAESRSNIDPSRRQQVVAPSGGVLGMPSPREMRRAMESGQLQGNARPPTSQEQAALERAVLPVLDAQIRAMRDQVTRSAGTRASGPSPSSPATRGATPAGADPASVEGLPAPVDGAAIDP